VAWDAVVTAVSATPLGVLALVGWQRRMQRRSVTAAMGIGVAALVALEAAQIFIRSHSADITDVLCGGVGLIAGALVGLRTFDRALNAPARDTFSRWAWIALATWCLMLAAYHWQPFDFVVDESLIRQKLARTSLVPLAGYRSGSDLNAFNTLLAKLGMAIPFGAIASIALRNLTRRPAVLTMLWVGVAATVFGAIELGQFFLPTRVPDPSDVGLGVAGSGLGIWLVRWLRSGYDARRPL
jgi:glycopeptide antibiotics resistance protein